MQLCRQFENACNQAYMQVCACGLRMWAHCIGAAAHVAHMHMGKACIFCSSTEVQMDCYAVGITHIRSRYMLVYFLSFTSVLGATPLDVLM